MPRRPTNLDNSRARPTVLAAGADGGCLSNFPSSFLFFVSLC